MTCTKCGAAVTPEPYAADPAGGKTQPMKYTCAACGATEIVDSGSRDTGKDNEVKSRLGLK